MKLFLKDMPVFVLAILISTAIAFLAVHKVSFLTLTERTLSDIRLATFLKNEPIDPDVVILGITEDTLALFPYREPVDRAFLADALKTLAERHPKVIAMDVLFDQATEPAKDQALKQAIAEIKTPLVISYTDKPDEVNEQQLAFLNDFVPPEKRVRAELFEDPVDGVVRSIFPGKTGPDGRYVMGFARGVAALDGVETPARTIEMAWHGRPDIDTEPFRIFPAQSLKFLPADWFTDKIVLIGGIFTLRDRHRTPFATVYGEEKGEIPGIEVHAHAVSQLIHHQSPRNVGPAGEVSLVLLLAAIGTIFGRFNSGLVRHMLLTAATLAILLAIGFTISHYAGPIIPIIEPSIAFLGAIWGTDAFTGREAKKQKEFINSAFARYLNPQLVHRLSEDPSQLQLGGVSRPMTLMFCDIRGFTTISEKFDAQGLTRFINRFLTPMTDLILSEGGTIDKYMGDAIMAFWNAPLDDPDHALHGCRAALGMRTKLDALNHTWKAEADAAGQPYIEVHIGIGLNTGICCVGNVGSDQRFDYSVLGDDVNLASRLEGQSKTYGVDIVIGENTAAAAPGLAILELDSIKVKGKTRPVRIHALIGDEALAETSGFKSLKADHDAMLDGYRRQDWKEALDRLERCRDHAPELMHGLYALYEARIADYVANPPPAEWDGVYVALSK